MIRPPWDAFGNTISTSNYYDYTDNYESISLTNLPAGVYTATIYDYYLGEYVNPYSASYRLTIDAPQIPLDVYESNNTFATATALGTLSGEGYLANLSIHNPTDLEDV